MPGTRPFKRRSAAEQLLTDDEFLAVIMAIKTFRPSTLLRVADGACLPSAMTRPSGSRK
jgi:hypothetical protein